MTPEAEPTKPADTGAGTEPAGMTVRGERLILLTVMLGIVLAPLNSTMIAVALPDIMTDFDVAITSAGWLITAYLISMASLQPLAGKLGDRFGHRNMVLSGLSVFGFVSIGAALSPSLSLLLAFRVLQAVCAALIVPNSSALLREILPAHRRGAGFGLLGAGIAVAAAGGPPLGGLLVELAGWRSIFYVNLIFVAPALLIGFKALPSIAATPAKPGFDIFGAMALPVVLVAAAWILISFSKGAEVLLIAVGIPIVAVGAIAFGWYERRQPDPIVQLNFFLNRSFSAAAAGIGFANLSMYSLLIAIPLLLSARDDSSLRIGLILTAMSAGMVVSSFAGGRMIDRLGRRLPTTAGMVLLTVGVVPIALAGQDVSLSQLLAGLSLVGLGLGLSTPGLQTSAVEAVSRKDSGSAAGLYSTSRYLGSIIGSAVIAAILGADKSDVGGLGLVFILSLGAAAIAIFASLGLSRGRPES
ncbi:MAG: MFS transporter [Chloroflexi bacterium]|nr:MFS transporter [Chloroflexota bacterium]MDA1269837.1 MFS transporter [Chloroflexota bacterium]